MLALQYGDGFLELANPVGVVTKWVSTAFNNSDDLLGSGNDLSFDLAETPGNHVRLGFANNLANRLAVAIVCISASFLDDELLLPKW